MSAAICAGLILLCAAPGDPSRVVAGEVERTIGGRGEPGAAGVSYPERGPEPAATRRGGIDHSKLITQDTDTLGKGVWQVQFHSSLSRSRGEWDTSGRNVERARAAEDLAGVAITAGVTHDLDVGIEFGYGWARDPEVDPPSDRGIGNPSLVAKWRFHGSDRRGLSIAYTPALTAPVVDGADSGRPDSAGRAWTMDNRLCLVGDLTRRLAVNLDVGGAADLGREDPWSWSGVSANGALGYQVTPLLQPEIELRYARETGGGERGGRTLAGTLGIVSSPADRISFRIGVQHALAGRNTDRTTTLLFSLDVTE